MVWPMGVIGRALTTDNVQEVATNIKYLLKMQCGNGVMHESVHVNDLSRCTRMDFEWANALMVKIVHELLPHLPCEYIYSGNEGLASQADKGSNPVLNAFIEHF